MQWDAVDSKNLIAGDKLVGQMPLLCLCYYNPLPSPRKEDWNRCRVLPKQGDACFLTFSLPYCQADLRAVSSFKIVVYRVYCTVRHFFIVNA